MATVTCPSCGEKGKIPPQFIGTRIKCKKCGNGFLVAAPSKAPAQPQTAGAPAGPTPVTQRATGDEILVEGLDDSAWSAPAVETEDHEHDPGAGAGPAQDESTSAFTAAGPAPGVREYKVLTPKDKFFAGKFEMDRVEAALNYYARQGWVVRGMATPHVAGFSGPEREQLIIVMERG